MKQNQITTQEVPAFSPSDPLSCFPQPFYSPSAQSFLMKAVRAVLGVCDAVLSSSLQACLLRSFYTAPENALDLFLTSLFGQGFDLPRDRASLVLQGLEQGFTKGGLELLSRGVLGTPSVIRRLEPCTVLVSPLLPTSASDRYLFLRLALKIKWPSAIVKFDFSYASPSAPACQPIAIAATSQLQTTIESELEGTITEQLE